AAAAHVAPASAVGGSAGPGAARRAARLRAAHRDPGAQPHPAAAGGAVAVVQAPAEPPRISGGPGGAPGRAAQPSGAGDARARAGGEGRIEESRRESTDGERTARRTIMNALVLVDIQNDF